MYQINPHLFPKEALPTMYDLPSENQEEPGLPDEFHDYQPELLRLTFRPPNYPSQKVFSGSDLNLYYDVQHTNWYKRPDWFGVLNVSRFYEDRDLRLSYVIWQEEVAPYVVVELISPGTEQEDLGKTLREVSQPPTKWQVYEQILQIPYYFVFNRYTKELKAFGLVTGHYKPLEISGQGVWLEEAQLGLGLWHGDYQGFDRPWLRWYDVDGNWLLTPSEMAEQERQIAEQERQIAEQERQIAEQERQIAEQERQIAEQERQKVKELQALLAQYQERFGELDNSK